MPNPCCGLVFPAAYGGKAEQSPPGSTCTARLPCREGAPPGTGGGLCHCLLTGTVSALVYKRRGEPRGWLGLGAGPDPSGSKPGLPGAVPGPGSPAAHAAHPAHGRSALGEDFISAQRQQCRPTVSPGDRAGQGGPWYTAPALPLLPRRQQVGLGRCLDNCRWGRLGPASPTRSRNRPPFLGASPIGLGLGRPPRASYSQA